MESTAPIAMATTAPLVITPISMIAAFGHVPDPRRAGSVRYPLPAILRYPLPAILSLATTDLLRALGFRDGETWRQTTLHRLFRKLGLHALSAPLTTLAPTILPLAYTRGSQDIMFNGKAQHGRLQHVAVTHSINVIAYHVIKEQHLYTDLGTDYLDRRRSDDTEQRLVAQIRTRDYTVSREAA